jgi:hypothetical protein
VNLEPKSAISQRSEVGGWSLRNSRSEETGSPENSLLFVMVLVIDQYGSVFTFEYEQTSRHCLAFPIRLAEPNSVSILSVPAEIREA